MEKTVSDERLQSAEGVFQTPSVEQVKTKKG